MDALLELSDVDADAGGKARGLARLGELGLPVPRALVLPADAYARWRASGSLSEGDFRALADALARLGPPLAVRSSATDEDAAGRSAAGQYESVMGIHNLPQLVQAVERCFRAGESERAVAYRGGPDTRLALVLQSQVRADRAGVGFSIDPIRADANHVLLEVVFGHGEQLVSGEVAPDRYWVARDRSSVRARLAEKSGVSPARRFMRTLRDDEARRIAELVLRAEEGFAFSVDIEFCFAGSDLWLVQCRPITTLGARAA